MSKKEIVLTDTFLRQDKPSLPAKILLQLLKRKIEASDKKFTKITNRELAEQMAQSIRTVNNKINELKRMKLVFVVTDKRKITKRSGERLITTLRYIYDSAYRAGIHQRSIDRRKNSPAYREAELNRSLDNCRRFEHLFRNESGSHQPIEPVQRAEPPNIEEEPIPPTAPTDEPQTPPTNADSGDELFD
jgi:hypothetical protein